MSASKLWPRVASASESIACEAESIGPIADSFEKKPQVSRQRRCWRTPRSTLPKQEVQQVDGQAGFKNRLPRLINSLHQDRGLTSQVWPLMIDLFS
jgi:hypothetical protein